MKLSHWATVALAISAMALGVTAALLPTIAQSKTPKGILEPAPLVATGRVTHEEFDRWNLAKVQGGKVYREKKNSWAAGEEACITGKAQGQTPEAGLAGVAVVLNSFNTVWWLPMGEWGKSLRFRAMKPYTKKQIPLVLSASKEIHDGAIEMSNAFEDFSSGLEGLAGANCDQQDKLASAEQEYGVGFPQLSKGFAELQRAELG